MPQPPIPPIVVARTIEKLRHFLDRLKRMLFPAAINILELTTSYWTTQCVFVAAQLDVAGHLKDGPKDIKQLAQELQVHEESLFRVLRLLAGYGLFKEVSSHKFAMTAMAKPLLNDGPDSVRGMCLLYGRPFHWKAWGDLLYSVKTGNSAVEHQVQMPFFEFLAKNPDENEIFNQAMTGWAGQAAHAIAKSYNFGQFKTVIDVGGGHGTLLAAILERHKNLQGILFDQRHVTDEAAPLLKARGVFERCRIESGSFFKTVPVGANAYILKNIIHDWNDEKSIEILSHVREAMNTKDKLLLVESVIPEGNTIHIGKLVDLEMLVCTSGGKERTRKQFEKILEPAGFKIEKIYNTVAIESVIEAKTKTLSRG